MKAALIVPAEAATATATALGETPAGSSQSSDVAEAHASVAQSVEPTAAEGVRSREQKPRPETLRLTPLEAAALRGAAKDTEGAGSVVSGGDRRGLIDPPSARTARQTGNEPANLCGGSR